MQSGTLTVTGKNSTIIPLSGRPRETEVHFKHEHNPVPCNPHHHDHLEWKVIFEDEDAKSHHKVNHHHHDRLFFLMIEWDVSGLREIDYIVLY